MALSAHIHTTPTRTGLKQWIIGTTAMLLALLVFSVPYLPAEEELPEFDLHGRIDEIHTDWILVDDTLIKNDPEFPPEYVRASDGIQLTRSSFRKGDYVGVQYSGIDALERLWKLDGPPPD